MIFKKLDINNSGFLDYHGIFVFKEFKVALID